MSSGSESDEDYVPGEPEPLSEEESANEETDQQYENEVDQKVKKRKIVQEAKGKKKRKLKNDTKEIKSKSPEKAEEAEIPEESEAQQNPEEIKKKEDELWAMFLEGTESQRKKDVPAANTSNSDAKSDPVVKKPHVPIYTPSPNSKEPINDKPTDLTKKENNKTESIFEFAGETIVVENNKIKDKIKTAESSAIGRKQDGPSRGRPGGAGGLASVLGQLNKKNKLSTLEKSKLDWSTYKKDEGIEEEIESHNKGKNGYLDRRDFLERSDVRQYELERDLRLNRRSNR